MLDEKFVAIAKPLSNESCVRCYTYSFVRFKDRKRFKMKFIRKMELIHIKFRIMFECFEAAQHTIISKHETNSNGNDDNNNDNYSRFDYLVGKKSPAAEKPCSIVCETNCLRPYCPKLLPCVNHSNVLNSRNPLHFASISLFENWAHLVVIHWAWLQDNQTILNRWIVLAQRIVAQHCLHWPATGLFYIFIQ